MSNLTQRLIVAAIGIPALIGIILLEQTPFGVTAFQLLIAGALFLGTGELMRLAAGSRLALHWGLTGCLGSFAVTNLLAREALGAGWVLAVLAAAFVLRPRLGEGPGTGRFWGLCAAVLGGLLALWFELAGRGAPWVFLALFATFASDTFAYTAGRLFGRHKLAPAISPGKTVEGAIGALVATTLAVPLLCAALGLPLDWRAFALGPVLSVVAQAGDLAESYLKRVVGVKDSGALLPGHGGLLDRIDALVFAGPLVYYWSVWVSPLP